MCGIVSILSCIRQSSVTTAQINRALDQLTHRGPDGREAWCSPSGTVALGHARLSIIDLATGAQPIANEDGSVRIVVNGEFYGHDAERAALRQRGHRFSTASDSEILLHHYEERGTDCLSRLRGEFAFVLWDETSQTLFAARDRLGMKPLFYAQHQGRLFLASEIKALLAAGVPAQWNMNAVSGYLKTALSHGHETLFAGIFQLPPGCFLLAHNGNVQVHTYWDYQLARTDDPVPDLTDQDWIEEFRRVLVESVRLRLRSDVPLAVYLSGGLDSCAILGIMAELTAQPPDAFTLSFTDADYDESAIARRMANSVGANHHPIHVSQQSLADNFADAIWHGEAPLLNGHGVSKFILSRALNAAGFKVALNGQGADEILAGYAHFRQDLLLDPHQSMTGEAVEQALRALRAANPISAGFLLGDRKPAPELTSVESVLGYVPAFFRSMGAIGQRLAPMLSDGFAQDYGHGAPYRVILNAVDVHGRLEGRHPVNQSLYLWSKTVLSGYILCTLSDRMEMAHSIEGRVPFLDHHVVELMASLPIHMKIRGTTEKYLLREAARPYVTEEVYHRQKHPFLAPPASANANGAFYALMQDQLRSSAFGRLGFFDQGKVIDTLDHLADLDDSARRDIDSSLMVALSFATMAQAFGLSA